MLPAQIVTADLNGDGRDDLVVRNAGDGTLTVFFSNGSEGDATGNALFPRSVTLWVGRGVSDVALVDTTGSGLPDIVVTNKLTGLVSVLRNLGGGNFGTPVPYRAGTGLLASDNFPFDPTVVTPASATPSPVTGTTTTLSVLGADDGGETNLTYTWAATTLPAGAAAPTFSVNGTNAAKQTVATFSEAGTYGFTVTIADAGGLTTTSSVNVVVNQSLTSIAVSPTSVTVNVGGTQQFTATAKDQFGNAIATQPSFTWAATAGTITTGGLFTAPTTTGSVTVTATSGSSQSSANVNVTNSATTLTPPAAPSFTATAVSATQINLAWTPVAGATGYLVDQWINGAWKQVGSLGSGSTGYAVTGLSPNTTYYFDVAAYNAAGTTWANYQSATTQNTVSRRPRRSRPRRFQRRRSTWPGPRWPAARPATWSINGSTAPGSRSAAWAAAAPA